MNGICPKCQKHKKLTEHHYLPRRIFGKRKGKTIYFCRDCHIRLEKFIPKTQRMPIIFYFVIVKVFLDPAVMKSAEKQVRRLKCLVA